MAMERNGYYMWKRFNKWILTWKPIHLCWWFLKHGRPIPKYFIGGGATAPSVTTNAATNILGTTATGNGNITSDGGANITERGFVFSKTSVNNDPIIGGTGVTKIVEGGTASGVYSDTLEPLTIGTGYSYKAYATNSKGTGYGSVQTFTTNTSPTVALNTPADTATGVSTTPTLEFTGTDINGDDIRYNVQVHTNNAFGVNTYYFDASDSGPNDPGGVWGNDANLFDKNESTSAFTGTTGSKLSNYIEGHGTEAPTSGASITQVRARIRYDDGSLTLWSLYSTLTAPGGGWSWAAVSGLETRVWLDDANGGTCEIYEDGDAGGTALVALTFFDDGAGSALVFDIQIEVTFAVLLDKVSGTDDGFANTVTPADTDPFNSGEKADYDVQAGDVLNNSTEYFWRVRGLDPTGSNTYGDWSSTRSFTTEAAAGGEGTAAFKSLLGVGL